MTRSTQKSSTKKPSSLRDILTQFALDDKGGYITREFQDYGYRLACDMKEESRKSMYIKLAKTTDRSILERARTFVMDAPNVTNPGRLFMWAVGRLKKGLSLSTQEKE